MRRVIAWTILFFLVSSFRADGKDGVQIKVLWNYHDFSSAVVLYDIKGQVRLWETKSVSSPAAAPIGEKIADGSFMLKPGSSKRFAIVIKNDGNQTLHFFSAPHTARPIEHSLGFKIKCLCVNKAFTIGPGETWYRIVEFRLSEDYFGSDLTITHDIIGIDQKRAEAFSGGDNNTDF